MLRLPALLLTSLALPAHGDPFDDLRLKWRNMLTGGDGVDYSLDAVRERLSSIESSARSYWKSLQKDAARTALWTDLASATSSSHITSSWSRLRAMALAWGTPGQSLCGDAALLADIRAAMEWMEQNRYSARVPKEYDNWWDWEIGTPLQVNDALVLLYDALTPEELVRQTAAVDRFVADPRIMITRTVSTGANLVWKCQAAAVRAILAKDAAKVQLAGEALSPVFRYVTSGDGFYQDGSFIQHGRHPYTGGYGNSLVGELGKLLYLLAGSPWDVADPGRENVYRWVLESFQPVVYRGAMMDMVRGREVSRSGSPDHAVGHSTAAAILRISQFAPEEAAARMRAMLKEWYLADTSRAWSTSRTIEDVMAIHRLLGDENVRPRGELPGSWIFAGMDRVVHLRPGWGLGIAMHSSRVYNYESINNENLRGWHTGDGMTYLYNADLTQFSDGFWPTVDPQRLPGTTVIAGSTARQSQAAGSNIAGGATVDGYSAVMMQLRPDGRQLEANKSWFLLDEEVIALGAGITAAAEGKPVETIVENRMITGDPAFTSAEDGAWAHLEGTGGYWFPAGAGWKSWRGDRQGSWRQLNTGGSSSTITRRFHTVWFDHGATPAGAAYAYGLLPGRSSEDTAAYAAAPGVQIVENTAGVQAIVKPRRGLRAVNFWTNEPKAAAGVSADRIASVLVLEDGGTISIGVADPTQANIGAIQVEVERAAASVIAADDTITVEQLAPTLRLSVNVKNARGRTHRLKCVVVP